jgi:Domain of unknown function (DUF4395)
MEIDLRGSRFAALITTVVLAVVLVTGSLWLLAAQAVVFDVGAVFGLRYSPYGLLYRKLIRPRLGPPAELEPEAPPRFAQAVGLVFALTGMAGYAAGLTWFGMAATAAALAAAFLNAVFGLCLGCEMYVLIQRIRAGRRALVPANADKEA